MKLHEIKAIQTGVPQTTPNELVYMFRWEAIIKRRSPAAGPLEILRRNLRSRIEFLVFISANDLAKQALASSFAVGPRRVEEVAPQGGAALQGLERLFIV